MIGGRIGRIGISSKRLTTFYSETEEHAQTVDERKFYFVK